MSTAAAVGRRAAPRAASPYLLAAVLGGAGVVHFAATAPYAAIVPSALPGSPRGYVYASGLVELACAAGLARSTTRRSAAWASAALFVAVFPANIEMALASRGRGRLYRAVAVARLPLQLPLVLWAARIARSQAPGTRT